MAKKKKRGLLFTLFILGCAGLLAYQAYKKFFGLISLHDRTHVYLYVERGDKLGDITAKLQAEGVITDPGSFEWMAERMELPANIHPGRYRITSGMTMRRIINLIRYRKEEKVKLSFNSQIHDLDEFIRYVDEKLSLSAQDLEDVLTDEEKLSSWFDLDPASAFALVVPSVYETSWATTPEEFFALLRRKYDSVWNEKRRQQLARTGLNRAELITLASIVQSESAIASEQRKIAGVYLNRLRRQMPLQADPTLKFANKNYSARRIYDKDKLVNSPYNTYRFKGLPPGPICLVSTQAIDASLNFEKHNYIYFCAKPELNGYSNFSSTLEEHGRHAQAYRKALDKMGIQR